MDQQPTGLLPSNQAEAFPPTPPKLPTEVRVHESWIGRYEVPPTIVPWNELLFSTKAKDIAKKEEAKIVVVDATATVLETLKILSDHNILSTPVAEAGKCIGFVDVLDVITYAAFLWRNLATKQPFFLFPNPDIFFQTQIKPIVNFSRSNIVPLVSEDVSLSELLKAFSQQQFKAHRVALVDSRNNIVNIVSQSDVLAFAARHIATFPYHLNTIKELNLIHSCILISNESTLVDAINILATNRVSGVGLIDQNGKLLANFSASDLRGLQPHTFELLSKPAIQYLAHIGKLDHEPITCQADQSLSWVIEAMVAEHIHRVYVISTKQIPIGLVSISDIIPLLQARSPEMGQII
jgi:CBS domain-containing protein